MQISFISIFLTVTIIPQKLDSIKNRSKEQKQSSHLILSYQNPKLPIRNRIKDLISRMTLPEKARQLDMYSGAKDFLDQNQRIDPTHSKADAVFNPEKVKKILGNLGIGSVHDLYPNPELYNRLQKWIIDNNRIGIPALFIEEGLHGYLAYHKTVFPQSVNLSSTWNTKLAKETGTAIASEARANGVDMILAPVLDIARDPNWGRVEEDFGEDPFLSGRMAVAYVKGMQGNSLNTDSSCIAEPKHFAAHGVSESGVNTAPAHAGKRELRMVLLKPFKDAVEEGHAMGIMAAYNSIDGIPCTANPWLLKKVLRAEWKFNGFVLSDLGAIERIYNTFNIASSPAQAVRLVLKSGVDMQFYDFPHDTFQNAIIYGVKNKKISIAVIDSAVSHILRVKFLLGLFDNFFIDNRLDKRVCRSPDHLALSLKVARQSMCLLKNNNHLLPLKKDMNCIAVIGPNADSTRLGDYTISPNDRVKESMLEQIKKITSQKTKVIYSRGDNISSAVNDAKKGNVVILALGENNWLSGEGNDRSKLGLPGKQSELLKAIYKTGVPVILVLQNGRPLTIPWAAKHIPAILEAWYPGEFGGRAIAETLFGDNNPAGRLSISFPKRVRQLPVYYNHGRSKKGKYVNGDDSPEFRFGTGLSYTTFKYSNLKINVTALKNRKNIAVSFDVTNTGKMKGDEVAELYVHNDNASVELPEKSLKGFESVHLRRGETRHVTFHIKKSDLAVWGAGRNWEVEPGRYSVTVGGNYNGALSGSFTIK